MIAAMFALLSVMPAGAMAASEVAAESKEARLEGYEKSVFLNDPGSSGLTWLFLVGLSVVPVAVMFKDAKRTHLD